uniref:Dickkopf WNT signaling pathway inhibitor 1 n=1 Tax=Strigops habroptila TaxID=2489341 RepID=A0A672V9W2_STRHB
NPLPGPAANDGALGAGWGVVLGSHNPRGPFEIPSAVPSSPRGRAQEAAPRGIKAAAGSAGSCCLGAAGASSPRGEHRGQGPFPCAEDEDCGPEEFCGGAARGGGAPLCLACRRRRKRCLRDAMCCPGSTCSNGERRQGLRRGDDTLEIGIEILTRRTPAPHMPRCPHTGEEGDFCLRSSDCAAGLCCARHFWSKICKPVLQEGQVCTRHRRKGTHGLEIFQRCQCAEGLVCRLQREHGPADASRLHTCQQH